MSTEEKISLTRREFFKETASGALGAALGLGAEFLSSPAAAAKPRLIVWACGGLAEALNELNRVFERKFNCRIFFTSAAAGYLTKALAHHYRGPIDVFAPRTATTNPEYLVKYGKMKSDFRLFCVEEYVVITPRNNPAGIRKVKDLGRAGVRLAFPPKAAIPNSKCVLEIVEAAGVKEQFLRNVVVQTDCPRKFLRDIVRGKVHAAIVERRLSLLPLTRGRVQVIPIEPEIMYAGKRCKEKPPFTIGLMTASRNPELARKYIAFTLSEVARPIMEKHGFVHVKSPQMKLYRRLLGLRKL
ncbi:MAG TPA: ABC transporter substrate-binding protein [Armatimonadetes bacterium]|nr:ABC transporter substrate-binding protein [Armatimonadota bacterium]